MLDTTPPCDLAAEKCLIATMLYTPDTIDAVRDIVTPASFYDPRHARIFGHLSVLKTGDITLIVHELKKSAELEACGGLDYLGELAGTNATVLHAAEYAQIVADHARRRAAARMATELLRNAHDGRMDPTELLTLARAELDHIADEAGPVGQQFEAVSCEELAAGEYDVEFLIENTLVAGQPCMIGAAPKSMKTILTIDAAISLATATPFMGQLEVNRACRVGFMSGEGGMSVLQDYARRVAAGRGIDLADIGGLVFCNQLPQLGDPQQLDALEKFIQGNELEVIVIDPLYLCMPGDDAGNLLKQGKILRSVNEICIRNKCTPILIHHTKKSVVDPQSPAELSDLSWSGFSEFAGQWWLLSRREKYDADQPGEHALWLNIGGRAGHSALYAVDVHEGTRSDLEGRRWGVDVKTPKEARAGARAGRIEAKETAKQEQIETDQKLLVHVLAKLNQPESKTTIRSVAGLGNGRRFEDTWGSLIRDGSIVLDGTIQKGNKRSYEAFRLDDPKVATCE